MQLQALNWYKHCTDEFTVTGYGNIFIILLSLAVGCTGKGQFGISSWKARFGISTSLQWEGLIWH